MKKTGLLNSQISHVISLMGHTDMLTIGDCGLPVPEGTGRIDLALTQGVPTFLQAVDAVLSELKVEEAIIAEEIYEKNPEVCAKLMDMLKASNPEIIIKTISHEEFKKVTRDSKAVVRTGECTPYANVILKSGVVF